MLRTADCALVHLVCDAGQQDANHVPLLDMPTMRHFLRRQLLHDVLFFLLMTHWPLFLHSPSAERLL